jgi:thiol-disulfide isomerase/thioredoxin
MKTALITIALAVATWQLAAKAVKSNIGQSLPELKLTFVGDKPDLAGKPLLLEFWATWCEPCRESIPHVNELWKAYKDKGLVIIGVTKEEEPLVKAFIKEVPMQFPIGLDPTSSLAAHFGITIIPHAMLVDKNGKVTWEGHPSTLQPGDIEALLK